MFSQAAIVLSGAALASAGAILPRQNSGSGGSALSSPGAIGFAYPPLRGWSSETSTVQPCGGFALGGRTDFPLTGGQVSLVQARDGHDIQLSYTTNPDPQSLADFQPLLPNVTHLFGGTACLETPDFSSLGLAAGQVVTLQLQYNAGPQRRNFQQCADVTLVPSTQFVPASEYTCVNYTRSTQTRSGGNTAAASAGSSSSGSGKTLSLAGAGGIGAGVALIFAAAVLGLLTVAGLVTFGKKSRAPTTVWKDSEVRERDDASTLQGTNSREEKVVA